MQRLPTAACSPGRCQPNLAFHPMLTYFAVIVLLVLCPLTTARPRSAIGVTREVSVKAVSAVPGQRGWTKLQLGELPSLPPFAKV